jgi:hypothetical protein
MTTTGRRHPGALRLPGPPPGRPARRLRPPRPPPPRTTTASPRRKRDWRAARRSVTPSPRRERTRTTAPSTRRCTGPSWSADRRQQVGNTRAAPRQSATPRHCGGSSRPGRGHPHGRGPPLNRLPRRTTPPNVTWARPQAGGEEEVFERGRGYRLDPRRSRRHCRHRGPKSRRDKDCGVEHAHSARPARPATEGPGCRGPWPGSTAAAGVSLPGASRSRRMS